MFSANFWICLFETSDYIERKATASHFETGESWAILSPIEQSIKRKIEAVGKPLKDWGVQIYRGILTGYNEAFIISGAKRNELIAADPKSAEIIRPILLIGWNSKLTAGLKRRSAEPKAMTNGNLASC
jgi:hypothetical protein